MKVCLLGFLSAILVGCGTSNNNKSFQKEVNTSWEEHSKGSGPVLFHGIPAYGKTTINYKRSNKTAFKIKLSEPILLDLADKPEPWGFYQFPTLSRLTDGSINANWSLHEDNIQSYGTTDVGSALSKDGGKTWKIQKVDSSLVSGMLMPSGDRIQVIDKKPIKVEDLKLPKVVGKTNFTHRKSNFTFYRLHALPASRQGVYINRLGKGETKWQVDHASLYDPQALRYSFRGYVPVVFWGDIHFAADKSLIAGIYPGYHITDSGVLDWQMGVFFYRSTDEGRSWKIQGRIPYDPDVTLDAVGKRRIGFSEPCYEVLPDGSFLSVIRTTDGDGITNGLGNGPMYYSRSTDLGKTWTKPKAFTGAGVMPRLLQLDNGVLVLSSGRPGVQLRFSTDGKGEVWTDPIEMMPHDNGLKQDEISCGYTGIIPSGPNRFFIIYSDFKHLNEAKEPRKSIKVREVIVNMK